MDPGLCGLEMTLPRGTERFTISARRVLLRARASWALVIALIGLATVIVGLVQYVGSGSVSIWHGRNALVGAEAIAALAVLSLVSIGFLAYGLLLRSRARRLRDRLQLRG